MDIGDLFSALGGGDAGDSPESIACPDADCSAEEWEAFTKTVEERLSELMPGALVLARDSVDAAVGAFAAGRYGIASDLFMKAVKIYGLMSFQMQHTQDAYDRHEAAGFMSPSSAV